MLSQLQHGWGIIGHVLLCLGVANVLCSSNMGFRQQRYFQVLKSYLIPLMGFDSFGFLVLLGLFTCDTDLLHFIQSP